MKDSARAIMEAQAKQSLADAVERNNALLEVLIDQVAALTEAVQPKPKGKGSPPKAEAEAEAEPEPPAEPEA